MQFIISTILQWFWIRFFVSFAPRLHNVSSNNYLELAKLDYKNCQGLHLREWNTIHKYDIIPSLHSKVCSVVVNFLKLRDFKLPITFYIDGTQNATLNSLEWAKETCFSDIIWLQQVSMNQKGQKSDLHGLKAEYWWKRLYLLLKTKELGRGMLSFVNLESVVLTAWLVGCKCTIHWIASSLFHNMCVPLELNMVNYTFKITRGYMNDGSIIFTPYFVGMEK